MQSEVQVLESLQLIVTTKKMASLLDNLHFLLISKDATLVFHDQSIDISSNIEKIKDKPVFHAGPIIRREYPFQNESIEDRKKYFKQFLCLLWDYQ